MSYKLLEHTSDLFIQGEGKDLKEALESLAEGMFKNMGNTQSTKEKFEISNENEDPQILIIEFFSKILSECETEGFIPKELKIKKLEKNNIEAEILGEHGLLENSIKSVTYHLFEVKEGENTIVRILFDI